MTQLGTPLTSTQDSGADDGGWYQTTTLHYAHLTVEINERDRIIQRLFTLDSALSTPSGVRVGMSIQEVAKSLRAPEADIQSRVRRWEPILCRDGELEPDLAGPTFEFTPARGAFDPPGPSRVRTLKQIEMTAYGP